MSVTADRESVTMIALRVERDAPGQTAERD